MIGLLAMTVYLGCYTDENHPNGLKTIELDEASGALAVTADYRVSNALYQAFSPDGKWLYTCTGEGLAIVDVSRGGAEVPSDSLNLRDFAALRERMSFDLCHIAVMPGGKQVVFADYRNGFAGSVAVADGHFGEPVIHRHSGSGPNLPRQNAAHCHQSCPLPDGSGYVVCDLGLDELVEYPARRIFKTTPAGAGPRHILFHPNGRLAFLVSELGNLVSSLAWNPADGFRLLDLLPTLERAALPVGPVIGTTGTDLAAAIRFTPDGKRLVVSNRGENSLVVYDFDESTGKLAFKSRSLLPGSWPRDFIFVTDTLALVALERSGEVVSLRYDPAAGTFTPLATLGGLFRPVALTARPTLA